MDIIYIVEDDDNLRELVIYTLKASGFKAEGFAHGEDFLSALSDQPPALAILDIMLPGLNGLEILGKIRKNPQLASLPVIMLTAKDTELDKIKGLDLGADDYITKPFSVLELIARIKAVLRRVAPNASQNKLVLGGISLDPSTRVVLADETGVNLTYTEFELLQFLMENPGIVLSRDRIMDAVWGTDYMGQTRTIDMYINFLRQKLGDWGKHIITIRGVGYKIDEVEE